MTHVQGSGVRWDQQLNELKSAHGEVRRLIVDMERLTAVSSATRAEYTGVRFHLSRASLARRTKFNTIVSSLRFNATAGELLVISKLMQINQDLMAKSSAHVSAWDSERVGQEWPDYCAASKAMRREMLLELKAEEEMLFPVLEARAGSGQGYSSRAA
jgi:hypothetical protein